MLFEVLNSISVNTFTNLFIDYTLLTVAFFSFFTLVNNLIKVKKEVKVKNEFIARKTSLINK
jgi:hypothetical protein